MCGLYHSTCVCVCMCVCVGALVAKPTVLVSTCSDRNQRGLYRKNGNKEGEKKGEGA